MPTVPAAPGHPPYRPRDRARRAARASASRWQAAARARPGRPVDREWQCLPRGLRIRRVRPLVDRAILSARSRRTRSCSAVGRTTCVAVTTRKRPTRRPDQRTGTAVKESVGRPTRWSAAPARPPAPAHRPRRPRRSSGGTPGTHSVRSAPSARVMAVAITRRSRRRSRRGAGRAARRGPGGTRRDARAAACCRRPHKRSR